MHSPAYMSQEMWFRGYAWEWLLQVSELCRLRSHILPNTPHRGTPIIASNPHPALSSFLVATSPQLLAPTGSLQEPMEGTPIPGKKLSPAQGPGYTQASSPTSQNASSILIPVPSPLTALPTEGPPMAPTSQNTPPSPLPRKVALGTK